MLAMLPRLVDAEARLALLAAPIAVACGFPSLIPVGKKPNGASSQSTRTYFSSAAPSEET